MFLLLNEIPNHYACIYKLNYPNGKIYIGQTCNLKRRMSEHNNINKASSPCDCAIRKYGKIKQVEILEEIQDLSLLDEREKYWISFYDSNNKTIGYNLTPGGSQVRGEDSVRAIYTNSEVLFIRKSRYEGKRKIDIYKTFFSDRSFSGFEKIWLGVGWENVGQEYLIETNSISRQEYSSKANAGENNNKAKLKKEDVLNIRQRYDSGEKISDIWKDYNFVSKVTISRVCKRETWKTV